MENAAHVTARGNPVIEWIFAHRKLWEYLGNALLAIYGLVFLVSMLADFRTQHRPSSLFVAAFEGATVWFSLMRPMPKTSNVSLYDWTVALLGSFVILFIRPAPQVHDHVPLLALQLIGMSISLAGLLSLNKSFGLVAANRGVKTSGMYAVVRHPIYAGYFLSFGAYLIQNMTLANVVIYGVFVVMELLRLIAEERVLLRDPAYAAYARQTRWRVLPFVI
jgi:protein-S-isoprenylcysteine O-methyltransferase Ste14